MNIRFTQVHLTIANFVLVGALAIVLAMCVRDVIEHSVSNEPDVPAVSLAAPKAAGGVRTRAYYDAIVKRDIFNEVPQESGPAPVVEEDLNLKLIGTSLQSKSKPYAIIEDEANTESLYQVGEDIPNAGKLVSVETNRAIIDRDGHRVAIEIPAADVAQAPPSTLGVAIKPSRFKGLPAVMQHRPHGIGRAKLGGDNGDNDDSNTKTSKVELKKLGPGKFQASRAEVAQTMENPAQFFSQMRAMPHFVNGKTDGFSISQVAQGSVFDQLGLQNGDLVTSIDGKPVTNPMQAMGLMQSMKTDSALDLTINRGGTPTTVHLDLR
jgi:general secretion pathway protein C